MGKQENFTVERVASFKCQPGKTQSIYWDGKVPGLGIRVTQAGAKAYVFETRLHGKTVRLTIGSPDSWPLETQWRTDSATGAKVEFRRGARQEAARLKTLTDQGIDPREIARAEAKAKADAAAALEASKKYTLEKLYEDYCAYLEKRDKPNAARQARSFYRCHVPEHLRHTPAKDIDGEQVADVLRVVTEAGSPRSAGCLRTSLLAAFNLGLKAKFDPKIPVKFKEYGITANPVALIPAIPSGVGDRVLTESELRAYLKGFDGRLTDKALALALLAGGQRMEQVLRATTADWDPDLKTLQLFDPKGRRATARIHLLPLAPRAAAIVESLLPQADEEGRLFVLDRQTPGKRVKKMCIQLGINPPFSLQDIRRTVETRMAALGISKDMRAHVLSHGLGGVQAKHYDRYAYFAEKHQVLTAWENYLTNIETGQKGSNVIPLDRSAA